MMLNRVIEKGSVSGFPPHGLQSAVCPLPPSNLTAVLSHSVMPLQVKCAQYWPHREEKDVIFGDTNFKLTLVSEDIKSYYTVRQLELENLSVSLSSLQCVCKRRHASRLGLQPFNICHVNPKLGA